MQYASRYTFSLFNKKAYSSAKSKDSLCGQGITGENLNKQADTDKQRSVANRHRTLAYPLYHRANRKRGKISHEHEKAKAYRNEIKSYIVRAGMTMTEVVDYLADEYGWSCQCSQPVRQTTARFPPLRRGCGTGQRAGL